jgi:hypothetical protein
MVQTNFTVPEKVTFEQAIALSQSLLDKMQAGILSPVELEGAIAALVQTANGARGFFVTYLTSDKTLADNPSLEVVEALRQYPDTVAELLVKNLAMSAAQAVFHRRNDNEEMAQGSDQVRSRTANLIELLDMPAVREISQQLIESATTGEGSYQTFLNRWGYDVEQREVICEALKGAIADKPE